jgi:hypothetical protein
MMTPGVRDKGYLFLAKCLKTCASLMPGHPTTTRTTKPTWVFFEVEGETLIFKIRLLRQGTGVRIG